MDLGEYTLYWEDVQQRLLYGSIDDLAWKLAEQLFAYKKHNTLYVFQHEKLAAFYSNEDSRTEAHVGYDFYRSRENVDAVISIKKKAAARTDRVEAEASTWDLAHFSDTELKTKAVLLLDVYMEGLSAHYLTQPQFFEQFEKVGEGEYAKHLSDLAEARFTYSKGAWMRVLDLCNPLLQEFSKRHDLSLVEAQSVTYTEFVNDHIPREELRDRVATYAVLSKDHDLTILTGKAAESYVTFYNEYISKYKKDSGEGTARGVIGNAGVVRARAFVMDSEYYDPKNPPQGMEKGMVLIVQNAWPDLVAYYQKASAIVTNEGGITSHGVVVARELGIPCIVGTRIGTKIFKTNDLVEVDANSGIVRKL